MGPDAPWPRRLLGWMQERFPPVVYTLLVLLFWVSAVLVARGLTAEGGLAPAAALVVWAFFLHLRVFDEHKDFDKDVVAHPERLLSQGVVTLPFLRRVGAVALLVEAGVAAWLGTPALLAWLAAAAYSVAMLVEFGVGRWLNRHMVVYAVTHNPVVAGLALFLYMATGARWEWAYLWFVLVASLGSLAFEIGRKTKLPDEEHPDVPSYTSELGQTRARLLLVGIYIALWASLSGLLYALRVPDPWPPLLGLASVVPGLATAFGLQAAKRVEAGASAVLLLGFATCAVAAWAVT